MQETKGDETNKDSGTKGVLFCFCWKMNNISKIKREKVLPNCCFVLSLVPQIIGGRRCGFFFATTAYLICTSPPCGLYGEL
eukprot:m.357448 g.357448  ORF g.357448 m.357448 type:complete len:81 (-) comp17831_c0_seq1:742-984(-)